MRFRLSTIMVVVAMLLVPNAHAQSWSADAVAQHCTIERAFGQRFGERARGRTTSNQHPLVGEISQSYTPRDAYEPFDRFEVKLTPRSRRVVQITAVANFASENEAQQAYTALSDAYTRGGRFPFQSPDRLVRQGEPEGISFKTEEQNARLVATVALSGRELYLVCADYELIAQGLDEAFGRTDRQ
jgi:hypothetical protein